MMASQHRLERPQMTPWIQSSSRFNARLLRRVALLVVLIATVLRCGGLGAAEPEPVHVEGAEGPMFGLGSWMWDKDTQARQECGFWTRFEIPPDTEVGRARMRIAADNFYRVFLDGRVLGQGSDWRIITEYDVTLILQPGPHILAVQAVNDFDQAGVLLGLKIELADGRTVETGSGTGWRVVPPGEGHWERRRTPLDRWGQSVVVAPLGGAPWQNPGPSTIKQAPPLFPIEVRFWQAGWFQATLASVCGIVIFLCLHLGSRVVIQSREQQIVRRERARIARDIHDELTAGLTKLVLLGETTRTELPRDSSVRSQITELCEQTRGLLTSMNETIWMINSQRDTVRDLVSYVCKYAETFLRQTPIRCRFDVDGDLPSDACDVATRRNLFLAVKEALNNVVRHSRSTEVHLRCHCQDNTLVVVVEDNGSGFDRAKADPDRNGLSNMQQRALEVGGTCQVVSQPGRGCRIEFRLPLNHSSWNRIRRVLSGNGTAKNNSSGAEEHG
jgi:two-component sensor histidine kinase